MPIENKPWLNNFSNSISKKIDYSTQPLQEILRNTAKKYPEKAAIGYYDGAMTYRDLNSLSDRFAAALSALGIKKGERVALFLPNIPQFIIAYYGILKAGAVVTAISPLHKDREVEHQLSDSGALMILVLDSLHPIVERVWKKTKLKTAIVTSSNEFIPNHPDSSTKVIQTSISTYSFQQLLEENEAEPPKISTDPNVDLAALQYTGGTTGKAKGAMLTHVNLVSNALIFAAWISGCEAKETFLTALPLFHIYGMTTSLNVPISLAAKIILMPKFEPAFVMENIQKHGVTVFCGVPTMYSALLANPNLGSYNLTSIRVCISGASGLPPQVQKGFMEVTGGLLAEGYGLTEASPVTHCNPVDKTMKTVRVGSIGLPLPETDAKIVDAEIGAKVLRAGETGELVVKGPQVMKGYWRQPEETAKVLRDGWLFTGDIGRMDEEGYFYITDRKKDLIKYKDYSVFPREIEDVLYEHAAVKLCAVVGKPDSIAGEIPKAFIVLKEGAEASSEEIIGLVKQKLAPYKVIREVEFRKELPLSSVGKVLRRVLREEEKAKAAT